MVGGVYLKWKQKQSAPVTVGGISLKLARGWASRAAGICR
jgi:hypothetical protein